MHKCLYLGRRILCQVKSTFVVEFFPGLNSQGSCCILRVRHSQQEASYFFPIAISKWILSDKVEASMFIHAAVYLTTGP